jgi:RNA polymerase sigma factor (sigma-70 family)
MKPELISRGNRLFRPVSTFAETPDHRFGSPAADGGPAPELGNVDDAGLLALVVDEGDEAAFSEFYRRKSRSVYSLIRRQIGDQGMTDEAVQEAFISVWRFARGYRPERGAVDAWLFTIARHAAYNVIRRRRLVPVGDPPDRVDPSPTPDDAVLTELETFRVHAAVDELPRRERDIIERAYFQEMSQSEIAAELGVPLGTIKTRNRSALRRLADILNQDDGAPR